MAGASFPNKDEQSNLLSKDETENSFNQDGGNKETELKHTLEKALREIKEHSENFYKLSSDLKETGAEVCKSMVNVSTLIKEITDQVKSGEMSESEYATLLAKDAPIERLGEDTIEMLRKMGLIGVGQERLTMGQLMKIAEKMMREFKETIIADRDRFIKTQESIRATGEKLREFRDKILAQVKMNNKRLVEERRSEMGVSQERKKAKMDDDATEAPSNDKLNNVEDEDEKLESPKKVTEDEISEAANLQMTSFSLIANYGQFEQSFVWTIRGVKDKMSLDTFSMASEVFKWAGYPVSTRAKLELEDDYVSMFLEIENIKEAKCLKVMPQVYYLLKGQDPSTYVCQQATPCYRRSSLLDLFEFDSDLGTRSFFTTWPYDVNDSMGIEIYVEPPSMAQLVHSRNGTLNWIIKDYDLKLRGERRGLIWDDTSPYFYTGPKGFKVQASMQLSKKEAVVHIVFLAGEYDSELPLTFLHETTVTLVNRKNPEASITKTVEADVKGNEYEVAMGSFDEIKKAIENDKLFCHVTLKPIETNNTEK